MTNWKYVAERHDQIARAHAQIAQELRDGDHPPGPEPPDPPDEDLISEEEQRAFSAVYMQPRKANQWAKHNPGSTGGLPLSINPRKGENYSGRTAVECYAKWKAAKPGVPEGRLIDRDHQQAWLDFQRMKYPVAVRQDTNGDYHAEAGARATNSGEDEHEEVEGFFEGVEQLQAWGA